MQFLLYEPTITSNQKKINDKLDLIAKIHREPSKTTRNEKRESQQSIEKLEKEVKQLKALNNTLEKRSDLEKNKIAHTKYKDYPSLEEVLHRLKEKIANVNSDLENNRSNIDNENKILLQLEKEKLQLIDEGLGYTMSGFKTILSGTIQEKRDLKVKIEENQKKTKIKEKEIKEKILNLKNIKKTIKEDQLLLKQLTNKMNSLRKKD